MKRVIIASVLALSVAAPAMAQDGQQPKPQPHPMEVWQAPTSAVCFYAGQPYSVGAVRDGQVCAYENDTEVFPEHKSPPVWRKQPSSGVMSYPAKPPAR